jgi:Cys-rich four helix bundle protein (predicted Tat secretion target)
MTPVLTSVINRRAFVAALPVVAMVATASQSSAAEADAEKSAESKDAHDHAHQHHAHGDHEIVMGPAGLIAAVNGCISAGNACIAHCLHFFAMGDASMAACCRAATEMTAYCTAMARLSALNSKHLKQAAALCAALCSDCEAECRKHADAHPICKECADSCQKTAAECKKV